MKKIILLASLGLGAVLIVGVMMISWAFSWLWQQAPALQASSLTVIEKLDKTRSAVGPCLEKVNANMNEMVIFAPDLTQRIQNTFSQCVDVINSAVGPKGQ